MEDKQWNVTELASKIGVTSTMVYEYFKKEEIPNSRKFQKLLSSNIDINPDWLIQGIGEMYLDDTKTFNDSKIGYDLDLYNYLNLVEEVRRLRERIERLEKKLNG